MRLGRLEVRGVAVESWPPGVFRAQGPAGRFVYLQLAVHTIEVAWLSPRGRAWDEEGPSGG